ncbi:hypothetical protein KW843_10650 [Acidovorax sp. sif1233]|uniref:hypothetical protein n=1 Tax=Acidovorax sp. sif1233 TaxID=2854792 RepID=UPI001C46DF6A|nr:hypothetical protein [Acidovorax sp. sif1233]MBV7454930.1 hypothetical protein [Acidovorax sp. sif1233]
MDTTIERRVTVRIVTAHPQQTLIKLLKNNAKATLAGMQRVVPGMRCDAQKK